MLCGSSYERIREYELSLACMNQLLFADDTVLIENSREDLQRLMNEFDIVCKRGKLKVKVGKTKAMVCGRTDRGEIWI